MCEYPYVLNKAQTTLNASVNESQQSQLPRLQTANAVPESRANQ